MTSREKLEEDLRQMREEREAKVQEMMAKYAGENPFDDESEDD